MKKRIVSLVILVLVGVFLFKGIPFGKNTLSILSAYSAKAMCSCVFVADRDEESVRTQELAAYASFVNVKVDQLNEYAIASAFGVRRIAQYRKGLGCTIMPEYRFKAKVPADYSEVPLIPENPATIAWPFGDLDTLPFPPEVNQEVLEIAFDDIFTESNPDLLKNTRAAIVVYKNKIIAERYAEGFTAKTPQLGWSMTKSVTNALVGIMVREKKMGIKSQSSMANWHRGDDPREKITLDHLMRMSSGLDFDEEYFGDEDATRMLFLEPSAPNYAVRSKLIHEPGSFWSYSSGTTNIISEEIRDRFINDVDYLQFPRKALFNKIGMRSAILETDANGTFVGSSFMYATARDWARFGLLYLNDGVWQGERILPEGWVDYSRTRTESSEHGIYGAQFWTAATKFVGTPMARYWPDLPDDIYYASGFEGQQVVIIPSKDMVIVRLGLTSDRKAWDLGAFIADVLNSIAD